MRQRTKKSAVQFREPVDDLIKLGESLQLSLDYTVARYQHIKSADLKLQTRRVLDKANYMFRVIGQTVTTIESMRKFLQQSFCMDVDAIFALAGKDEYAARVSTHSGMVLVNNGIRIVIDELEKLNVAIDKEHEHEKAKTQSAA
jgi:hypothetical protein